MAIHSYTNHGNYSYRGKVTAKILDGNKRVLCSHNSHNGGTKKFFQNLNKVLTGNLPAEYIQPRFLVLYKVQDMSATGINSDWETFITPSEKGELPIIAATQLLPLDSWLFSENTSDNTSSTKLQIQIPFTYITEDEICIFALYPSTVASSKTSDSLESSALAYYKLTDGSAWKPFSIDKTAKLNSLAIEWDLAFFDEEDTER